jgi:hypothetical protein
MAKYELVIPFEDMVGITHRFEGCSDLEDLIMDLQISVRRLEKLKAAGVKYVIEDDCITFETHDEETADRLDFIPADDQANDKIVGDKNPA